MDSSKRSSAPVNRILHYKFPFTERFRSDLLLLKDLETAQKEHILPQLFFDTYGAIDMLSGLAKFGQGSPFKKDQFKASSTLVYALSYRNWLGPIHLLPPHTEELIFKIKSNDSLLFREKPEPDLEALQEEMWGELGLKSTEFSPSMPGENPDFNWPEIFKAESVDLLKAFYLLRERSFWKARYQHLKAHSVLHFSQEAGYRLGDVAKTPLFDDLWNTLNKSRPSRSENNYMDAVALCLLDQKLQAFEANPTENQLPIFYCLQSHILEAVEAFSQKAGEDGHIPFTWRYENRVHRIVQDSDFFILYGVTRDLRQQNHGSYDAFFKVVDDFLSGRVPAATRVRSGEINALGRQLTDHFEEKVLVEFFDNWWKREKEGEINEFLFQNSLDEDQREKLDADILAYIEEERDRLSRQFDHYNGRIQSIKQIWEGLRHMEAHIRERFKKEDVKYLDVFKELSNRFSFPDETCADIQRLVDEIFEAVHHQKDSTSLETVKGKVVTMLVSALFDPSNQATPHEFEARKRALGMGLAVLWIFEYYALTEKICERIRHVFPKSELREGDVYPDSTIALMHAAAILKSHKDDDKTVEKIIACIKFKPKTPSYKVWNSLSFIYFLMWDIKNRHLDFPELCVVKYGQFLPNLKARKYGELAGAYCRKSVEWLEEELVKNGGSHETKHRYRRYCYALNNLIFFHTYLSEPASCVAILSVARRLEAASKDPDIWDEAAYFDTLARYYFRLALLAEQPADFDRFLRRAADFSEKTKQHSKRNLSIFETLGHDMEDVQHEGFENIRRKLTAAVIEEDALA